VRVGGCEGGGGWGLVGVRVEGGEVLVVVQSKVGGGGDEGCGVRLFVVRSKVVNSGGDEGEERKVALAVAVGSERRAFDRSLLPPHRLEQTPPPPPPAQDTTHATPSQRKLSIGSPPTPHPHPHPQFQRLTAPAVRSATAPLDSSRHSAVSATPVIGPLTSGSLTSLRKGERYWSGWTADQSVGVRGEEGDRGGCAGADVGCGWEVEPLMRKQLLV